MSHEPVTVVLRGSSGQPTLESVGSRFYAWNECEDVWVPISKFKAHRMIRKAIRNGAS